MSNESAKSEAIKIFRAQFPSAFSTSEALNCGVHPRILYQLRDEGFIEQVSRGVYIVAEANIENLDFLIVSHRVPKSVVCLESALYFYEITTQIPKAVMIAMPRKSKQPKIDHPPIIVYRFSEEAFNNGIEEHEVNNEIIKIYSPEKTLADCFKFRNQLGMDVVLEALKMYKEKYRFDALKIAKYAKICRVSKIIQPYMESLFL